MMKLGCQTSCLQRVSDHCLHFGAWELGSLIRQEVRGRTIAARGKSGMWNRARFRPLTWLMLCALRFGPF